ncbi:MAG: DUF2330 domain-containing protein [Candidatus Diapherotrites archaeon]|nr:DUF2330 domain-containing protein [Candidatus Diapherotrites archaeon]
MKKNICIAIFMLVFSATVFADGCIIPDYDYYGDILAPEQKAVIYWDGTKEQLILSTKISLDDVSNFAWVVPIQSNTKPEVEEADEEIFFELAELFSRDKETGYDRLLPPLGGMESGHQGVEVIETKKIDVYDIAILAATDSTALLNWLNENNFSFPEEKKNVLEYYVTLANNYKPYYFVANKVNLSNKYPDLAVSEQDRECAKSLVLSVNEEVIYDPYIVRDLEGFIQYLIYDLEYEECENTDFDAVFVLTQLGVGISTPLKYTFTPDEPTYPMHMTSVNPGSTQATVFLIGEKCFDDKEKYLSFDAALENQGFAQGHGFEKGKCITQTSFNGETAKLLHDSFFKETDYAPSNPDKSLYEIIWELIVSIIEKIFVPYA